MKIMYVGLTAILFFVYVVTTKIHICEKDISGLQVHEIQNHD